MTAAAIADAELVRLCQMAREAHTAVLLTCGLAADTSLSDRAGMASADAAHTQCRDDLQAQVEAICAITPRTIAGHAAMASLVLFMAEAFRPVNPERWTDDTLSYVPQPLLEAILANLARAA